MILEKLERRFGRFAVSNLTLLIIFGQIMGFVLGVVKPESVEKMQLVMSRVAEGEVWRLLTFAFTTPAGNLFRDPAGFSLNVIFLFFAWYLFYLMGTALEGHWGTFRYNIYIAIAYVATLLGACLVPDAPADNGYIGVSVFLAFAYLYPNFEILLFFLLPVKIKYLAALTWIGYAFTIIVGDWMARVLVLASVSNFLLFFGRSLLGRAYDGKRRMEWQARMAARRDKPFHTCTVCGATERTHPKIDFRYCSKCHGSYEYCADHLKAHEHVTAEAAHAAGPDGEPRAGQADLSESPKSGR
ncbi:MAG: hypothetical protein WD278_21115 [Pirellulales bacterium]